MDVVANERGIYLCGLPLANGTLVNLLDFLIYKTYFSIAFKLKNEWIVFVSNNKDTS